MGPACLSRIAVWQNTDAEQVSQAVLSTDNRHVFVVDVGWNMTDGAIRSSIFQFKLDSVKINSACLHFIGETFIISQMGNNTSLRSWPSHYSQWNMTDINNIFYWKIKVNWIHIMLSQSTLSFHYYTHWNLSNGKGI